jgi:two-component system cell cycle sensor histidine kinase/response regulator CckA
MFRKQTLDEERDQVNQAGPGSTESQPAQAQQELREAEEKYQALFTEYKRAVETVKSLEEQARSAQKMEAVGRLAGAVVHDFNNLLTAVIGYSQFILGSINPDWQFRKELEEIYDAGKRAAEMTRQLQVFNRKQVQQPTLIDFNSVMSGWGNVLKRLIGEDIQLVTHLDESLGFVKADAGEVDQVILNLIVNARDAMPQGGTLTIETANVELSGDEMNADPGPYILLSIVDTGHGMDAETRSRAFEPFFTTKTASNASGLGLSTAYGIVRQCGGYMQCDTEPGKGTTFRLYFPRVEHEGAGERLGEQVSALPRGTESVLLVEDEGVVRELAAKILRQQGYSVLEAKNGEEALRLAEDRGGHEIHLLVTDVVMPQMSGRLLADLVKSARPSIKILFSSGYPDSTILPHGVGVGGASFLQKPFTPGILTRKVREVLDGPA